MLPCHDEGDLDGDDLDLDDDGSIPARVASYVFVEARGRGGQCCDWRACLLAIALCQSAAGVGAATAIRESLPLSPAGRPPRPRIFLFHVVLRAWSEPMFIKYNASLGEHRRVAYTLLLLAAAIAGDDNNNDSNKRDASPHSIRDAVRWAVARSVPHYLDLMGAPVIRRLGLFVAESLVRMFVSPSMSKSESESESSASPSPFPGLRFDLEPCPETDWLCEVMVQQPPLWEQQQLAWETQSSPTQPPQPPIAELIQSMTLSDHNAPRDDREDVGDVGGYESDDSIQPFMDDDDRDDHGDDGEHTAHRDILKKLIRSPRFLRECVEYLKENGGNSNGSGIGSDETTHADRIALSLAHVEEIIRRQSQPHLSPAASVFALGLRDIEEVGPELARRLLHLHNNYNLDGFEKRRYGAIVAIMVASKVR